MNTIKKNTHNLWYNEARERDKVRKREWEREWEREREREWERERERGMKKT